MQTDDDDDVEFGDPDEMVDPNRVPQVRWERARTEIDVRDVVDILFGKRGSPIRCPFHGSDSTPSMYFMHHNDYHCYGCPEGDTSWDSIKIVARARNMSPSMALKWLEHEFHLPPLEGSLEPEEEVEPEEVVVVAPEEPLPDIKEVKALFANAASRLLGKPLPEETVSTYRKFLVTFYAAQHYKDVRPLIKILKEDLKHVDV